jgi:hypothetical protein
MKLSLSGLLFIASALLMLFGAFGFTFIVVPDLHGDLLEIGVRPTVLRGTVLHLYFAALAMFGFAIMVSCAAIQVLRGIRPARCPLAIIAVIHIAFGLIAFSRSHNPHRLGAFAMGVLLALALVIPPSRKLPA